MKLSKKIGLVGSSIRWAWNLVRSFKLAAVVVGVAGAAFVVASLLIGMPPFAFVIIVGLIAVPTGLYIVRVQRIDTTASSKLTNRRVLAVVFASSIGTMIAIQAIPYGHAQSNPPILSEPQWATPRTRELMVRACFGCHSNEVVHPPYASTAPISWAVQRHVDEGRSEINYSEFNRIDDENETIEAIREGSMPPAYYTQFGLHPEAKLTDAEIAELVAGLRNTPGMNRG